MIKDYPLSGKDVVNLVYKGTKKEPNILTYNELQKYKNIDNVLNNDMCIILYEQKPQYGHWTCIFKDNEIIEHFDSYGLFPDKELDFVGDEMNKMLGQGYPLLSNLLKKSPYEIRYSEFKYQSPKSETCGRWVAIRLIFRELDEYQFRDIFSNLSDKDIITFTNNINKFL